MLWLSCGLFGHDEQHDDDVPSTRFHGVSIWFLLLFSREECEVLEDFEDDFFIVDDQSRTEDARQRKIEMNCCICGSLPSFP
jgi:hypothetical protein